MKKLLILVICVLLCVSLVGCSGTELFSNDGVVIKYKGVSSCDSRGLDTRIELSINNSSDKNISVTAENILVNGCAINGELLEIVSAGKKVNCELKFTAIELLRNEVSPATSAEWVFVIVDNDTLESITTSDIISIDLTAE